MLNLVPRHKSDVVLADLATSKIDHVSKTSNEKPGLER
jgi:hypothetical protein